MADFETQQGRLSSRLDVLDLKANLRLLITKARNPRITSVADLDAELGISAEKGGFRQNYRPDRPSGIPREFVAPFLALFQLSEEEIKLPRAKFETFLDNCSGQNRRVPDIRSGAGWYAGAQSLASQQSPPINPGDVRFSWETAGVTVDFVSETRSAPVSAPLPEIELLNLRRRLPAARVHVQCEFRIEISLSDNHAERLLGLIEGSQLTCFQKPFFLAPDRSMLRIPLDGDPFYFDEVGRHVLWIITFGKVPLTSAEVDALDSEHARIRQEAAERIFAIAQTRTPETLHILRGDFDVVG